MKNAFLELGSDKIFISLINILPEKIVFVAAFKYLFALLSLIKISFLFVCLNVCFFFLTAIAFFNFILVYNGFRFDCF